MSKMETTFYDDQGYAKTDVNMLKKRMTLDLNSPGTGKLALKKQRCNVSVLSSPDLNMLRLASPELEKLIIQQNHGLVTTTPTPTQYFFPRNVTEEQETYAKGFVDALAELHHTSDSSQDGVIIHPGLDSSVPITSQSGLTYTTLESHVPVSSMPSSNSITVTRPFSSISVVTTSVPTSSTYPPVTDGNTTNMTSGSYILPDTVRIKEEPQTVPNIGLTPPLSPINMESQERIKLERKRLRNRMAASKCRKRKLERIGRLEDKVNNLKGENSELANVVNKLRDQVCSLKQEVMDHVHNGCQIMLSSHF